MNLEHNILSRQIDGLAMFNVCISDLMTYATDHFRGKLLIEAEVTTADGSTVKVSDASCAVNKHLVDLEFTKDTRRHFKPGLPYRGKVKSGIDLLACLCHQQHSQAIAQIYPHPHIRTLVAHHLYHITQPLTPVFLHVLCERTLPRLQAMQTNLLKTGLNNY